MKINLQIFTAYNEFFLNLVVMAMCLQSGKICVSASREPKEFLMGGHRCVRNKSISAIQNSLNSQPAGTVLSEIQEVSLRNFE